MFNAVVIKKDKNGNEEKKEYKNIISIITVSDKYTEITYASGKKELISLYGETLTIV